VVIGGPRWDKYKSDGQLLHSRESGGGCGGVTENASTENANVRICNGGKRKYSNLKSILKSLRFSSLAFSVDPMSVGLDQFTCTVPDSVIHKKSDS